MCIRDSSNIQVVAVGDGKVVYSKNNATWVWQPTKEPYQLFAFVIGQPKFDEATGMLYFSTGTANSLYRIKLPWAIFSKIRYYLALIAGAFLCQTSPTTLP